MGGFSSSPIYLSDDCICASLPSVVTVSINFLNLPLSLTQSFPVPLLRLADNVAQKRLIKKYTTRPKPPTDQNGYREG